MNKKVKVYIRHVGALEAYLEDDAEDVELRENWDRHIELQNNSNYRPQPIKVTLIDGGVMSVNPFEIQFIIFNV